MLTPGSGVVGLDFDATVAWPAYDWMGVAKAGLESTARYLARDLGPQQIRVNLVAAGPLRTIAAKSIPGFENFEDVWADRAPLGWDVKRHRPRRPHLRRPALGLVSRHHRRDRPRRRGSARRRRVTVIHRAIRVRAAAFAMVRGCSSPTLNSPSSTASFSVRQARAAGHSRRRDQAAGSTRARGIRLDRGRSRRSPDRDARPSDRLVLAACSRLAWGGRRVRERRRRSSAGSCAPRRSATAKLIVPPAVDPGRRLIGRDLSRRGRRCCLASFPSPSQLRTALDIAATTISKKR